MTVGLVPHAHATNIPVRRFVFLLSSMSDDVNIGSEGNPFPLNPDGTHKTLSSPTFNEAYAEMEKIFLSGKAKAIGVSNFSIKT